jgi:acyl-CoA thioester hydrolase
MKNRILFRNDYKFFTTADTRWRDSDVLGHINHTVYLSLLETKSREFMDFIYGGDNHHDYHKDLEASNGGLLASMQVRYIKQVHHPAKLDIGSRITRIGTKSYDIHHGIFVNGEDEPSFQSIHTFVKFNFKKQESIPVDKVLIDHLEEIV